MVLDFPDDPNLIIQKIELRYKYVNVVIIGFIST